MWTNNVSINHLYSTNNTQQVWAIFSGVSGWKRLKTGAADGVANLAELLSTAKAHGRKVNVFVVNNQVERALML